MKGNCGGCLDAEAPMRISFKKLHQWPESEAEFLMFVTNKEMDGSAMAWNERYNSRQKYLRSYTFSRKETIAEKTRKLFLKEEKVRTMKKKERHRHGVGAVLFDCLFACVATVDVW